MSILDPYLLQAASLNISLTSPLDKPAMVFILQKADSLGLLFYKPGMEIDWLAAAHVWSKKHSRTLTGQHLLAGCLHLASEPQKEKFLRPADLFQAVTAYETQQRRKALAGRQTPELPPELETASFDQELAYMRAWGKAAIATGDYQQATQQARLAIGLPAQPPQIEGKTYTFQHLLDQRHHTPNPKHPSQDT